MPDVEGAPVRPVAADSVDSREAHTPASLDSVDSVVKPDSAAAAAREWNGWSTRVFAPAQVITVTAHVPVIISTD